MRYGVGLIAFTVVSLMAQTGFAQKPSEMSCADLWMSRNQVYAETGYCFKTARAKAVFGEACFPPYGQMNREQQRWVAEIQRWEALRHCPK